MLEEAIEVIRKLWRGGFQDHRGRHYRLENCRIYDLPEQPPPILMSGFGPKSIDLAARIADGFVTVAPDREAVERFRSQAGEDRLVQGGLKVCWDQDEAIAARTIHRLWPNDVLPGELAQILPTPRHIEQATELVTEEMLAEATPCGPDLERYLDAIRDRFFEFYRELLLPRVREELSAVSPG